MLKILVFTSVHPWNDPRIYYKQVQSLAKRYEVDYYGIKTGDQSRDDENLKVYLIERPQSKLKRISYIFKYTKIALKSRAHIIHFHDPELLIMVPFIKLFSKKKVIYDVHEDIPAAILSKKIGNSFSRKVLSSIVNGVEKAICRQLDGIIFAEKYYKQNFMSISKPRKVDILNYPPYISRLEGSGTSGNDTVNLVYAGGLTRIRGLWIMVEAFERISRNHKNAYLHLIGTINEREKKALMDFIITKNLEERIILYGRIPLMDVYKIYERADIGLSLLLPEKNYINSLATKLFEYMAFGIPIIASDFPAWKKLIEEEEVGKTVNPENLEEVVLAIEDLIDNETERTRMGKRGRMAFEDQYNWRIEEEKLLTFYHEILRDAQ